MRKLTSHYAVPPGPVELAFASVSTLAPQFFYVSFRRLTGRRLAKRRSQGASSYSYGCLDFDLSTAKLSDALRTHRPASPALAGAPGAPGITPSGAGTRHAAGAACAGDPSPLTQA